MMDTLSACKSIYRWRYGVVAFSQARGSLIIHSPNEVCSGYIEFILTHRPSLVLSGSSALTLIFFFCEMFVLELLSILQDL